MRLQLICNVGEILLFGGNWLLEPKFSKKKTNTKMLGIKAAKVQPILLLEGNSYGSLPLFTIQTVLVHYNKLWFQFLPIKSQDLSHNSPFSRLVRKFLNFCIREVLSGKQCSILRFANLR
jgi:hypothetical protein